MPTIVDCANVALQHLGEKVIASLNDASPRARTLNALMIPLRQAELRSNTWTFAKARAKLPEGLPAPSWGYAHQYPLPVDFLRLLQVGEGDVPRSMFEATGSPYSYYKLEGRAILCDDVAPLPVLYVRDEEDVSKWDALFYSYFAIAWAWRGCMGITKDAELRDRLQRDMGLALADAIQTGAIEDPPTELPDDTWILSRF